MRTRALIAVTTAGLAAGASLTGVVAGGADAATAAAATTVWPEANKAGFGTARSRASNIWFTLQRGRVSEVFYPDLSTPSIRNLELVVTDGRTFTDRESSDMRHRTTRPSATSLRFTQVNTDKDGHYRLVKEVVTDPRRDSVTMKVRLRSLDGRRYRLFALVDPALGNDGSRDSARTSGHALTASNGSLGSALVTHPGLAATSSGLVGTSSDPWRQLARSHRLTTRHASAGPGNVVQVGEVRGVTGTPRHRTATRDAGPGRLGTAARRTAQRTSSVPWSRTRSTYDAGWLRYLRSLRPVPASAHDVRRQYLASALVIAAAEDKLHPGAFVASPSEPWVWGDDIEGLSSPSGAYHEVWARDAYEFGTALWADGDKAAARRIVDWLFDSQQKADGSFPQNSDVSGTPVWTNLQLDEVALPIVLAHLTGRTDASTYAHVKEAADFIADFRDPDHRACRALLAAGAVGEPGGLLAQLDRRADQWTGLRGSHRPRERRQRVVRAVARARRLLAAKVEDWTVTTNGPLSSRPYFLRLTKDGDPDAGTSYSIGDGGPSAVDQRKVVDPSFLDLVRYGIEPADDPAVLSSLPVVDSQLEVDTPNGPFWRRYSFDGYGETSTGAEWFISDPDTHQTLGRAWPLLAGSVASTPWPQAARDRRTCRRWRVPPVRATCSPSRSGTTVRRPGARAAAAARAPGPRLRSPGRTRAWSGWRGPSSAGPRWTGRPWSRAGTRVPDPRGPQRPARTGSRSGRLQRPPVA